MRTAALSVAAALLTLAAYWPALGLGFVWDDTILYLGVPALRDTASLTSGIGSSVVAGMYFFRPVALFTFKLQFWLFGDSAVAAHAIGITLHAVNTALVTALAARLAPVSGWTARVALAGALYGLHPALIEPVSWMSCRFDLLVAFWLLLALHAERSLAAPWARALALGTLYFAALCSKEMAAPFPAVLVLFQLATRHRDVAWRELPRRMLAAEWPGYALLVLALGAYVALRAILVGGAVDRDLDVVEALDGFASHAGFVAAMVLFHARNVLWPFDAINPLHPVDLDALAFGVDDALRVLLAVALLAALAWGIARRSASSALLGAALLALFPVLNVLPLSIGHNIGHERYLTFPLTLVALAVAVAPFPGRDARAFRIAAAGSGALAALWLGLAVANIRVTVPLWQSDVTLWSWAAAKNPDSDYAHYYLVTALLGQGRPDLAARHFTDGVPATAYRALARLQYARHLLEHGDAVNGERELRLALQGFPPWHEQPPRDGRSAREFEAFRGHIAGGYRYLAQQARRSGDDAGAAELTAIAAAYYSE